MINTSNRLTTALIAACAVLTPSVSAAQSAPQAVTVSIGPDGSVTVNGARVSGPAPSQSQAREAPGEAAMDADEGEAYPMGPPPPSHTLPPSRTSENDVSYTEPANTYRNDPIVVRRSGNYGHFMIRVVVNGIAIKAAVDTGAAQTFLTNADAIATGAYNHRVGAVSAYGIAGAVMTNTVKLDSMRVGGVDLGRPTVMAGPGINVSLLGLPQIAKLGHVEIDGDVMTITPRLAR